MAQADGYGTFTFGSYQLLLDLAGQRKLLFFGGKGGVGKTTVSAATALARAHQGERVLLVSTDPAHNLGHLFDRKIGSKPVRLTAGLDALELDPEETVELHMREVSRALYEMMPVTLHGEVDKHMKLSRDAPGMQEAAILERIAEVVETGLDDHDLIVFDTAPSGHTARLMALPEMMSAWTEGLIKRREKADRFADFVRDLGRDSSMEDKTIGGADQEAQEKESRIRQILNRRRLKFMSLRDKLADHELTSFVIVLAAERMPVLESIELHEKLKRAGIGVDCLVVNKRTPNRGDDFMTERHAQEEQHLKTLAKALPDVPVEQLELVSHDVVGLAALERFAEKLN
jgi:arsenite-transporting ATPase